MSASVGANPAVVGALLALIMELIQFVPSAIEAVNEVKALIESGQAPTQAQWDALMAEVSVDHAAVQNG